MPFIRTSAFIILIFRNCYFFLIFLDNQQKEGNESDGTYDSKNSLDYTANISACCEDAIFISGLPKSMSKESLFDKLKDIFTTCGDIKVSERTIL